MRHRIISPFLLVSLLSCLLVAQKRPYTARDHATLEMPSSPVISPDGSKIAYTVKRADTKSSKWITQVYVADAASHSSRQFTSSIASSTAPQWSPDGRTLSFLSRREFLDDSLSKHSGTPQLFFLSMDGGEAHAITAIEEGIEEYAWAPDGKSIAILTEEAQTDSARDASEERTSKKMDWTSSNDPKPGKTLYLYDRASGKLREIGRLDRGASDLAWAPDGSKLVYQTNYTGEYNDEQKYDIWTVDLKGRTTQLTKMKGPETQPMFSPDGRQIAFITQTVPDIEFAKTELSIMKADGSDVRSLTKAASYSVTRFEWAPDGRSIVALLNERTSSICCRISPSTSSIEKLTDPKYVVSDIAVAENGAVALGVETATTLKELAILKKNTVDIVTNFSAQLSPFTFGESRVLTVKSRDGKFDLDAVVVLPVGYKEGTRYPLLLAYHGGPFGEFDNKLYQYYPVQILAQEGVMTVMPNVRGGSGNTDEFSQANRYDLGGADFRDAMDIVDALIAKGMVDSTKMGVTGGSYGGYMTNWTISQTPRFKAAVSMYGIFSWFTDWSNSFQPAFEQMYFGYNYWERPVDMQNLWFKTSPQTYVKNIVTPTLILQGTEDQYTNISNSREMYAALKELGRTVEFVVYPRAEHGLRTEPNQYINVLERSVSWFKKYAMGQ
ncbi:MAG: S9 family peptidase [Acidobacteriota bacterium]